MVDVNPCSYCAEQLAAASCVVMDAMRAWEPFRREWPRGAKRVHRHVLRPDDVVRLGPNPRKRNGWMRPVVDVGVVKEVRLVKAGDDQPYKVVPLSPADDGARAVDWYYAHDLERVIPCGEFCVHDLVRLRSSPSEDVRWMRVGCVGQVMFLEGCTGKVMVEQFGALPEEQGEEERMRDFYGPAELKIVHDPALRARAGLAVVPPVVSCD